MKSVLISIQPKWVAKISSGAKTIEVRKTIPKLETPFKCYIYETKGLYKGSGGCLFNGSGKVIGEFVCDRVDKIGWFGNPELIEDRYLEESCLTLKELYKYTKGKIYYEWHISDLKIYDKPKELSEFKVECPTKNRINGDCQFCKYASFSHYGNRPSCNAYLIRPPMSWCYVEVGE